LEDLLVEKYSFVHSAFNCSKETGLYWGKTFIPRENDKLLLTENGYLSTSWHFKSPRAKNQSNYF